MRHEGMMTLPCDAGVRSPKVGRGSVSAGQREPDVSPPSDARVRRRVFCTVIVLLAVVSGGSYWYEAGSVYELISTDPRTGQSVSVAQRYGSYGLYLARVPPTPRGQKTIVLLGNSVYASCGIAETMQAWANDEERGLRFVNLAQTGSGIHDYIVQFALALAQQPDLVVVQYINLAFTPNYGAGAGQYSLPRFRSDCDQMVFDLDVARSLPLSFYAREFTLESGGSALMSTLLPAKRLDWLVRARANQAVEKCLGVLPAWYQRYFHAPTINMAADWVQAHRPSVPSDAVETYPPYPQTQALLDELVGMARARNTAVLFIRQEAGSRFDTPEVLPQLTRACRAYARALVVDLKAAYDASEFRDAVHPAPGIGQLHYVQRHYQAILNARVSLGLQPRPLSAEEPRTVLKAERFDRGNARYESDQQDRGGGVLLAGAGPPPTFLEYDLDVAVAADYLLRLRHGAPSELPVDVCVNGAYVGQVAGEVPGGSVPAGQAWATSLPITLQPGHNVLRLEWPGALPSAPRLAFERLTETWSAGRVAARP